MNNYCFYCDKTTDHKIKFEPEIFNVLNKAKIEVVSIISICKICNNQNSNPVLDNENLLKAFRKYEEKYGRMPKHNELFKSK